jgi:hypothetical protein
LAHPKWPTLLARASGTGGAPPRLQTVTGTLRWRRPHNRAGSNKQWR